MPINASASLRAASAIEHDAFFSPDSCDDARWASETRMFDLPLQKSAPVTALPFTWPMTFEFSRTQEGQVLVSRIAGERPASAMEAVEQLWGFFDSTSRECRRVGITQLLVVSDARGPASSDAVLAFYRRLEDFGLDRSMRIAVCVTDEPARRITALGVAVARSLGWEIELFGDEQNAKDWL